MDWSSSIKDQQDYNCIPLLQVYWVGPLVGAFIAAFEYNLIFAPDTRTSAPANVEMTISSEDFGPDGSLQSIKCEDTEKVKSDNCKLWMFLWKIIKRDKISDKHRRIDKLKTYKILYNHRYLHDCCFIRWICFLWY